MPQTVIASEAKQSLRLLRHCVPRNDTFLWTFTIDAPQLCCGVLHYSTGQALSRQREREELLISIV
jgi:hypothetical protein